ncbi:histone H3-K56 acetyltransferase [Syncephalis fuscata]|nr:histone H3-K56 acetyltransferase [Syncephalis fuscata]
MSNRDASLWQQRDKNTRRRTWALLAAVPSHLDTAVDKPVSETVKNKLSGQTTLESTNVTAISTSKESNSILVAGITVYEYRHACPVADKDTTTKEPSKEISFYIEKIDTTGYGHLATKMAGKPSITTALVLGLLDYAQMLGHRLNTKINIHTFARVQPQYLFVNSATNDVKQPLSDRGLLRWWLRTFDRFIGHSMTKQSNQSNSKDNVQKYWLVPGYEPSELGSWARDAQSVTHWQYGVPYMRDALAHTVFPAFPDDPIGRMLQSKASTGLNVEAFLALLSLGEECGAGKLAGIFTLDWLPVNTDLNSQIDELYASSKEQEDLVANSSIYDKIMNWLMHQADFSTKETAIKSTAQLKAICVKYTFNLHTVPATVNDKQSSTESTTTKTEATTTPTINNLQGLVKRRTPSSSNTVNNLQGLVKRHKSTTSPSSK